MANDIFEVLAEDHRRVEGILEAIEQASESEERMQLLNDLTLELVPHARAEERLVYPRIKEHEKGRDLESNAEEEHAMAEELIAEMQAMGEGADGFDDKLAQLKAAIQQHVKVEESQMFDIGREVIGEDEMADLSAAVDDAKQEVQASLEQVSQQAFHEPSGGEESAAPPP